MSAWKTILNHKVTLLALSLLIFLYLCFVYLSSKKTIIRSQSYDPKQPIIYAFWHNRLAMIAFLKPKNTRINVLISSHKDGIIIANVMKFFGIHNIAGSTNRSPIAALKAIHTKIKLKESIVITPDGPRGPMYQINSNIMKIASKSASLIVPVTYSAARVKIFNSWDKFILPLPFNRLTFIYGSPIQSSKSSNAELKQELDRITHLADNFVNKAP